MNLFKSNNYILSVFILFISSLIFLFGLEINKWISINKVIALFIIFIFVYLLFFSIKLYNPLRVKNEIKNIFWVFILFLPISAIGPFIQPPSDPVYHSFVLVNSMDTDVFKGAPNRALLNKEFYQILFNFIDSENWQYGYINLILYFHIFSTSLLVLATYISARLYGINFKWSLLAVLIMILFFGTDRFSYFTYYSLAPSSINMAFFWLFSGILLNLAMKPSIISKETISNLLNVGFIGICFVPIVYYNHHQEAGFFFFLYFLVSIIVAIRLIKQSPLKQRTKYISYLSILSILYFPSYLVLNFYGKLPLDLHNRVIEATEHLTNYHTIWIFGKLSGPRIWETLSFYGFFPLFFIVFYILFTVINKNKIDRRLILAMLPGLLTFWLMLVPLNFMIWIKAVKINEHLWRMAYFSQYWFTIVYFLYLIEQKRYGKFFLRSIRKFYENKKASI
ncbi:MAG: hypothetical protein JJT78_16360 [Leptospira sp.]|nr:hypothetical protein [Leptospira sp.]